MNSIGNLVWYNRRLKVVSITPSLEIIQKKLLLQRVCCPEKKHTLLRAIRSMSNRLSNKYAEISAGFLVAVTYCSTWEFL